MSFIDDIIAGKVNPDRISVHNEGGCPAIRLEWHREDGYKIGYITPLTDSSYEDVLQKARQHLKDRPEAGAAA